MENRLLVPLLALTLGSLTTTAFAGPVEDAIEYRQSSMVLIKWYFKPMAAMNKGKIPFDAQAYAGHAEALARVTSLDLLAAFPEGSVDEFESSAKAEIWANWADFKKRYETLQRESAKLAKVAATGDEAAMKKQFGVTAKSCKGCHEEYRSKK